MSVEDALSAADHLRLYLLEILDTSLSESLQKQLCHKTNHTMVVPQHD